MAGFSATRFALPLLVLSVSCGSSGAEDALPSPSTPPPPGSGIDGGDAAPPGSTSGKPKYTCVTGFPETPKIELPKDEARHGDFFEWWYWTGHLESQKGARPFGFQLTFFESTPRPGIPLGSGTMAHFAVTDVQAKAFHHDYRFAAATSYPQKTDAFRVANDTWWAEGTGGKTTMHAEMEGYVLDLRLEDEKRPVFQFGDGFTSYPPPYAGYTYYGSHTRLRASGTIVAGGVSEKVSGEVWMDQQWGQPPQTPQPPPFPPIVETRYGWNWFQIQLETGEELMLADMRIKQSPFLVGGTFVAKDCTFESLDAQAFTVQPKGTWKSPHTGITYPQNWHVSVPGKGLDLDLEVVHPDQELYKHGQVPLLGVVAPAYWEGKVTVSGKGPNGASVKGRGYAEVVGAAK